MAIQLLDGIDRLSVLEAENTLLKERLQASEQNCALLQAELARLRSQEQIRHLGTSNWTIANDVSKRSLDLLATDPDVNNFVGHVLTAIAQQFHSPLTEYWSQDDHTAYVELIYWQGQILDRAAIASIFPCHLGLEGFRVPLGLIEETPLNQRKNPIVFENHGTNPFTKDLEWITHELIPQGLPKEINVPLFWGNTTMGALTIHVHQDYQFTPEQVVLAQSLAHQVTLAVQLQHLAAEAQQVAVARTREKAAQERLLELAKANQSLQRSLEHLTHDANLDAFLGHVLMEITQRVDADSGHIFLYDAQTNTLRFHIRAKQGRLDYTPLPDEPEIFKAPFDADITPAFRHMCQRRTMISLNEDEFNGMAWPGTVEWFRRDGVTEACCLALMAGDHPVGLLGMRFLTERQPSPKIDGLVHALSYQATLAIQLTTLAEQAKQAALAREQEQAAQERATELEKASIALQQTIDAVGQLEQLDALLPEVLKIVAAAFGARSCSYFEHPNDERIYLRYWFYEGTVYKPEQLLTLDDRFALVRLLAQGFTVPAEYLGTQHRHRERAVVLDHLSGTCVPKFDAFAKRLDWGGELNVPLVCNGIAVGALVIYRETPVFTQGEITLAESLGKQIALAMQTSQIAERERQIAIAREQEKAAQERAAELATINEALIQRDRLLSVVAQVTQDLLENPNVEQGVAQALQKLGEASGASRMTLFHEKPEPQTGRLQHHILLEWTLSNVRRLMDHSDTCSLYSDDYPDIAAELHAGRSASLHLKDYPSPAPAFWTKFGVHSRSIVPILIEGEYFGCVCFDDCFQNHPWSEPEMDILTAGAGAIGAALLRQRLTEKAKQAAIMQEQERVTELIRANDALKRSLNAIAIVSDPHQIIAHILKIVAEQFDTPLVEYWLHSENFHTAHISLSCWQGKILTAAEQPDHPGNADFPSLRYLSQHDRLAHSPYFLIDDIRVDPYTRTAAAQIGIDIVAWFQRRGVTRLLNIPLWLNEQTIGSLDIWFPSDRAFTQSQIELAYTFGQQITLTSYLNRLFEETQQTVLFEERNRIASDIHDTLAQAFTGISLQLEAAKPLLRQDPDTVGNILHHISQLAKNGLAEARRSVWALYPPGEEYANLAQMLYESAEQMSRNTSITIAVNLIGETCPLTPYVGMNLLRIGQEAMTNALKHAQAKNITIDLVYESDRLLLCIRDDGCGFVPPTTIDTCTVGFGLVGMYERCDRINAQLTILSQPSCGTDILVESPLC